MSGPFQPLPPLVVGVVALVAAVEAVLHLGATGFLGGPEAIGWRLEAARAVGFFEPVFHQMVVERRLGWDALRVVSYPLVHGGLVHALFGIVLTLALGQAVGRRVGGWGLLVAMLAGAVAGAVAYGTLQHGRGVLIGVYPMVYGLIGVFTQGLLARAGDVRARVAAFRMIGVLAGAQAVLRLGFGVGGPEWVAELGGFAAGFGVAFLLGPEGAARVRRLRGS